MIRLSNGNYFDPGNPDPKLLDVDSIAHALSILPRYGGSTPTPYSVAEHCDAVAALVEMFLYVRDRELGPSPYYYGHPVAEVKLAAQTHDMHEVLTGWGDVLYGYKTLQMKHIEEQIDRLAIAPLLGISPKVFKLDLIHYCDKLTSLAEEQWLFGERNFPAPDMGDWDGTELLPPEEGVKYLLEFIFTNEKPNHWKVAKDVFLINLELLESQIQMSV